MTRTEKIDLIRELNPFYKTNSMLFAMTNNQLDEELLKCQNEEKPKKEETAKEKYYKNVKKRITKEEKQMISLQEQVYKLQADNLILKEEIKDLKKKLKRIGEIANA